MVRRWSYINSINYNRLNPLNYAVQDLRQLNQQETFLTTTYYRQALFSPDVTKFARRSFFRRRHLTVWLHYQQVLLLWAQDYLFFRRYLRFLLSLHNYRNNYITSNLIVFNNSGVGEVSDFVRYNSTFLVSKVCKFLTRFGGFFSVFKKSIGNSLILYISSDKERLISSNKSVTNIFTDFVYTNSVDSMFTSLQPTTGELIIPQLNDILESISINNILTIYKILILFTLSLTFN